MSVTGIGASTTASTSSSSSTAPTTGVDQTIRAQFDKLIEAAGADGVAGGSGSQDAALAYLQTLTPAQLAEQSGTGFGAHTNLTWGQYLAVFSVSVQLQDRQYALSQQGASEKNAYSPNSTAADRESAYITVLIGEVGHDVPGALTKAKQYLAGVNKNPQDTITLSEAALKALTQTADDFEAANPYGVASSPVGGS